MSIKERRREWIEEVLGQSTVQVNVRVPVRLRARMEEFLQYMERPLSNRRQDSEFWPVSVSGLVIAAIEDYLAHRPLTEKEGAKLTEPIKYERKAANG